MADIDQQPSKDLSSGEAIKKLREIGEESNSCMFHTNLQHFPGNCRPMAVQEVDDDGNMWFVSSTESVKNADIEKDPKVTVTFQNNSKWEYVVVNGTAEILQDPALTEKYWNKFFEAWFDGKDDPRISFIKVKCEDGHYWETQNGKFASAVKAMFSAVTGSKIDDGGVDGNLKL